MTFPAVFQLEHLSSLHSSSQISSAWLVKEFQARSLLPTYRSRLDQLSTEYNHAIRSRSDYFCALVSAFCRVRLSLTELTSHPIEWFQADKYTSDDDNRAKAHLLHPRTIGIKPVARTTTLCRRASSALTNCCARHRSLHRGHDCCGGCKRRARGDIGLEGQTLRQRRDRW